jgi:hypothetical protein
MSVSAATLATVIAISTFGSGFAGVMSLVSNLVPWVLVFLFVTTLAGELIGRALFYSVVTPTTMPGSLFLNNRGFEQLARDTGLAKDQMAGVFPHTS